jgi:hypothetical protein
MAAPEATAQKRVALIIGGIVPRLASGEVC